MDSPPNLNQTSSAFSAGRVAAGEATRVASALLFPASAQALAMAAQNAVSAQQQLHILAQAVLAMCVTELLSDSEARNLEDTLTRLQTLRQEVSAHAQQQ